MTPELPSFMTDEIREQAEEKADFYRTNYKLGIRGIVNLFSFIEKSLGYLLIRYPLGEESLQGFSAIYANERLICTNSSERLARERFTLAHELGHHIFDIEIDKPRLISDFHVGNFNNHNIQEYRADQFAASFLMPEEGLKKSIKELEKPIDQLDYFDIIQLQIEFGVSNRALIRRISDLNFINQEKSDYLNNYYKNLGISLTGLFQRANAKPDLLNREEVTQMPSRFYNYLQKNYDQNLIPYSSLVEVLKVVGKRPEELGFEKKSPIIEDDDNVDLDELLKELD